jgi:hypothetical protein
LKADWTREQSMEKPPVRYATRRRSGGVAAGYGLPEAAVFTPDGGRDVISDEGPGGLLAA